MSDKFTQLCVWPGTLLGDNTVQDFENFFKEKGFTVKFAEEVVTLPDRTPYGEVVEGTGGRHDLFFYIASSDILQFAVPRLGMGIRWWEDVIGNGGGKIYPQEILDKYPVTW